MDDRDDIMDRGEAARGSGEAASSVSVSAASRPVIPPLRLAALANNNSRGSTISVTANTSSDSAIDSSIFGFHPSLQAKRVATPKVETPKNLIVPEPSAVELPLAPVRPYSGRVDANTFSNAAVQDESDSDVHRRTRHLLSLGLNVPASAHKYRTPRSGASEHPIGDNEEFPKGSTTASSPIDDSKHAPRRRVAVIAPRTTRERLQLRCLRALQHVRPSLRVVQLLQRQLHVQQKLAYVLLLSGMVSECATPAPRYNVPIGIGVFLYSVARLDHRAVVAGLCLAVVIDVIWLLRPQETSFNAYFRVQSINVTHASLGVCLLCKIGLVFSTYADLGPEPVAYGSSDTNEPTAQAPVPLPASLQRHPLWHDIKFFFPRKTFPQCSHLSFEVLMRTLALIWLHGACGVALVVLGLVATVGYADRVQFRATAFGAPLHLMMALRGAMTLATYVVATQHMSYSGCLKLFRCHRLAALGSNNDDDGDIVLKYNRRWLRRVQRVKALDAVVGLYLLLVFYSAFHSGQFFAGRGLSVVLVVTALVVLVLDLWVPLLLLVVAKCGAALHAHHKRGTVDVDPYYPNQLEWEDVVDDDNNDDDSDDDGSDSDASSAMSRSHRNGPAHSDSKSDCSSSSSWSSSSSGSGGYSTTASAIRRRRKRQLQRRAKHERRAGSRKPLLPASARQHAIPIVDAHQVLSSRLDDSGSQQQQSQQPLVSPRSSAGVWVRHWHEASGRSYLVHSVTGESVWEIVGGANATNKPATSRGNTASSSNNKSMLSSRTPHLDTERALLSARETPGSARHAALLLTSRRARGGEIATDDRSGRPRSPPTSNSDVVVSSVHSPRSAGDKTARMSALQSLHGDSSAREASTMDDSSTANANSSPAAAPDATSDADTTDPRLTPHEFALLWDAVPDGGAFICRVSRIPTLVDLARHLDRHSFVVAFDGLSRESLRTVHFYAPVAVVDTVVSERPTSVRRSLSSPRTRQFFLGEFVFDSLSLKLAATFRCSQPDAIVPFVKKLQLRELVGAYTPCD